MMMWSMSLSFEGAAIPAPRAGAAAMPAVAAAAVWMKRRRTMSVMMSPRIG
jgi:hypothetical protein